MKAGATMQDELIYIAEAVVGLKLLVTRLGEQTASHDTSPEEICSTFEEIAKLAKNGTYWSSYVSKR
jgi:hypothetical protein